MNDQPTDEQVMAALADGRDAAMGELMRRWQAPVRCFISRMVSGQALVDDVSQEVWTRLYMYRKRFRRGGSFRSYLFTIAANCCRTAFTPRRGVLTFSRGGANGLPLDDLPANTPSPDEPLEVAEARRGLHRAIATLPHAQRAVVLLYLLCSADYGHIAEILGHGVSTTRTLMHRALVGLRTRLSTLSLAAERRVDHDRLEC